MNPLRAIVVGAGFAGEGHTRALQYAGVEVVALCARQPDVVRAMADKLGVGIASTNWRATLDEVRPDIVAIGTPAHVRREIIEAAVGLGCHLFCDKPLATTAGEAKALYELVAASGVKHTYAATHCYDPSVAWLAEQVASGAIGHLQQIVFLVRSGLAPVLPWSWFLMQELGGGMLNNHFVHLLAILERVVGGPLVHVAGRADFAIARAPVVPGIHDFRDWMAKIATLTPEVLDAAEWRECDTDTSYTALMRFATPTGEVPVTLISGPGVPPGDTVGMRLVGERGVLIARGEVAFRVSQILGKATEETELPVPERLTAALPQAGGYCEDRWAALAKEFVADIRGQVHTPYLTFRDGWRYQEAIDAIRC